MNADVTSRTQLSGRSLVVARAVWIALAVFYIGAYLVTVPILLSETPDFASTTEGISHADFLAGLAQIGVSPGGYTVYQQWSEVVVTLVYLALGCFIFWRKSDDWMALLTSLLFIMFLGPFETLARLNPLWTVAGDMSALVTSMVFFLWFFIFPDGRFVPRWTRWIFGLLLAIQVWRIFQPDLYQQNFAMVAPLIFGGVLIAQIFRYRHADAVQRQQIKWVVFGISAGTIPMLVFFLFYFAIFNSQPPVQRAIAVNFFGGLLWEFFLIILPLSLTLAILRSRLFDIDIIIRKTLVYSVLTGLLALIYFGGVVLVQQLTRSITASSDLAIAISTLMLAALFFPLRRRVQNAIDRRFYRRKYDAAKTLAAFGVTVRDEVELEKLTAELLNVVNETMQPASVSLWLKPTADGGQWTTRD
ncbi:MAG: hypothetical protein HGB05_10600 [Chloroflexi bacterium]|nr:hypothetical protein [Chloroflexota bacterium]